MIYQPNTDHDLSGLIRHISLRWCVEMSQSILYSIMNSNFFPVYVFFMKVQQLPTLFLENNFIFVSSR